MNQLPDDLHWIPDSVEHTHSIADLCELIGCESQDWLIDCLRNGAFRGRRCRDGESFPPVRGLDGVPARNIHPSPPDSTNAMQYVLNVSLTFGCPGDAEQAATQLATTVFNGLVSSWSEVEEVRW